MRPCEGSCELLNQVAVHLTIWQRHAAGQETWIVAAGSFVCADGGIVFEISFGLR